METLAAECVHREPWNKGNLVAHTIAHGHPLQLTARSGYNRPSEAHGDVYAGPK
jgi:hypothetical protein